MLFWLGSFFSLKTEAAFGAAVELLWGVELLVGVGLLVGVVDLCVGSGGCT